MLRFDSYCGAEFDELEVLPGGLLAVESGVLGVDGVAGAVSLGAGSAGGMVTSGVVVVGAGVLGAGDVIAGVSVAGARLFDATTDREDSRDAVRVRGAVGSDFATFFPGVAFSTVATSGCGCAEALGAASTAAGEPVVTDAVPALVSATVVSAVVGVFAATAGGTASVLCDTELLKRNAPPIAVAVMTPNAMPKCFTEFS